MAVVDAHRLAVAVVEPLVQIAHSVLQRVALLPEALLRPLGHGVRSGEVAKQRLGHPARMTVVRFIEELQRRREAEAHALAGLVDQLQCHALADECVPNALEQLLGIGVALQQLAQPVVQPLGSRAVARRIPGLDRQLRRTRAHVPAFIVNQLLDPVCLYAVPAVGMAVVQLVVAQDFVELLQERIAVNAARLGADQVAV